MSSSLWLTKRKKPELVDMMRTLGLDFGDKLKANLESELQDYLNSHESTLINHPTFSAYYDTLSPTKTSSRRRQSLRHASKADSTESTPEPDHGEQTPRRSARERKTSTAIRARVTRTTSRESTPASGKGKNEPSTPQSERPSLLRITSEPAIPLTPSQLVDAIDNRTIRRLNQQVRDYTDDIVKKTEIWEKVAYTKEALSSVTSVHAIALCYEFYRLMHELIPIEYYQTNFDIPGFGSSSKILHIPDFFILLTWAGFWAPVLYWALNAIFLPLGASYFINLSGSRKYDPLTFAVTKALIAYTVYNKGWVNFRAFGMFNQDTKPLVSSIVGDETPFIGFAVATLMTLWDGIVKTR